MRSNINFTDCKDMSCCVCEECYNDFNEMFRWKELDGWDTGWNLCCPKCRTKLKVVDDEDYIYLCDNCKILYDENLKLRCI